MHLTEKQRLAQFKSRDKYFTKFGAGGTENKKMVFLGKNDYYT